MPDQELDLDALVQQVQSADKYRQISPEVIRSILLKEIPKNKNLKETIKSTRNKLHQVGSAYQEKAIPYNAWEKELQLLPASLEDPLSLTFLQKALGTHASTRERLPILPRFFVETLRGLSPLYSILDVACGLNPLSIPWMPLAPGFTYTACDIYEDMTGFLDQFFAHFGIDGRARTCDLTRSIPAVSFDLALVLKTIPCLEQIDKEAGYRLLTQLNAASMLVSFPAKSLGGKSKGMLQNYERHFLDLTAGQSWKITRFEFPGELAFLVQK